MARKHGLESAMKNTRGRTMKREEGENFLSGIDDSIDKR
jgi:hypothetical protein